LRSTGPASRRSPPRPRRVRAAGANRRSRRDRGEVVERFGRHVCNCTRADPPSAVREIERRLPQVSYGGGAGDPAPEGTIPVYVVERNETFRRRRG
jgi:hypothetical protein